MAVRGKVGINEGGHLLEDDFVGILDAAGRLIPWSEYRSLGGEVSVGGGGKTLGRDTIMYIYEVSDIRHALYLTLPISDIIVAIFSLVNTSIDNNI